MGLKETAAAAFLTQMPANNVVALLARADQYLTEIKKVAERETEADLARGVQRDIDHYVQEKIARLDPADTKISCRKGCSFCCHVIVDMSLGEAQVLLDTAKAKGVTFSTSYLKKQAAEPEKDYARSAVSACVFLKNGECSVYEGRPIACRKYHVATKAKYCNNVRYPRHQVATLFVAEAEALNMAYGKHASWDRMAVMLLKALGVDQV